MGIRKIPKETDYYKYHNANPKNRRTTDCVLRALATFLDKSWEEVYEDLYPLGMKYKVPMDDRKSYSKYLQSLGYEMQKQPRKEWNNCKYTGKEFIDYCTSKHSNYLIHIGGHHLSCIKDNKIYDTWDCSDGCIGNYWVREV
jgi:hypothetical protein